MIYIRITRKEEKIRVNLCRLPSAVNVMLKLSIMFIFLQIVFATRAVLKIGEYISSSLHLARKYARIFVRGIIRSSQIRD